jgi:uncharacterized protein (DUF302 family)
MKGIARVLFTDLEHAEAILREELAHEGFGVLTEIDVARVLKDRLGVDRAPLRILGACNPRLADAALAIDRSAALVLPCNVVLEPDPRGTAVTIADPMELMPDPAMHDLATDATSRLTLAVNRAVARTIPAP